MHIVTSSLNREDLAVKESLAVDTFIHFDAESPINKKCGFAEWLETSIKAYKRFQVCDNGVEVDAPFDKFTVAGFVVDEVCGYEIGDPRVVEVLLDHVHGGFAGLAFDIEPFDLLNSVKCLL